MSSTARTLLDAALAADLTQNELKVFLALFRQTLCYGKRTDPLTLKRLVALTGIRKDRISKAIEGVINKGLFERTAHPLFEFAYSIPIRWMGEQDTAFFAPSLLKNRINSQAAETISEKQIHTRSTITASNSTPLNPNTTSDCRELKLVATELTYPSELTAETQQKAAHILDGLTVELAQACLKLLSLSLATKRIQSPLAYLHQLAKAAREGRLDTSALTKPSLPNSSPPKIQQPNPLHDQRYQLQQVSSEIQALDRLYQLSGLTMDRLTAQRRERLIHDYQALRTQLQEATACSV